MQATLWRRLSGVLVALAVLPGTAAAQAIDPTVVFEVSGPTRAAGSFLAVLAFGGAYIHWFEGSVDRAVDASRERPLKSVVYGLLAHLTVVFATTYAYSQLTRVLPTGSTLGAAGFLVAFLALLLLAALGLTVLGSRIVELRGERRLWPGLVTGATVGSAAWLIPSFLLGALVWIVVVSVGIGGPTRKWFHAEQTTVDTDPDA